MLTERAQELANSILQKQVLPGSDRHHILASTPTPPGHTISATPIQQPQNAHNSHPLPKRHTQKLSTSADLLPHDRKNERRRRRLHEHVLHRHHPCPPKNLTPTPTRTPPHRIPKITTKDKSRTSKRSRTSTRNCTRNIHTLKPHLKRSTNDGTYGLQRRCFRQDCKCKN